MAPAPAATAARRGEAGTGEIGQTGEAVNLPKAMGLRDVVLFFVTTGTNLQWVAFAAAAGPSSLVLWTLGALLMFLPLSYCVLHLAPRFPEEGGLYSWSKRAFGDGAGFIAGWMYWCSNLPYFPGLLYFIASNALYIFGDRLLFLQQSKAYFITVSILGLALGAGLNILGLSVGKWLNNIGGVTRWLATLLLVGLGIAAFLRNGSATVFTWSNLWPSFRLADLLLLSTIAFAWTGPEAASFMGDEIQNARRTVPRALLLAAPMIAVIYMSGTLSMLVAVPGGDTSALQGIMQAIRVGADGIGAPWLAPIAAALITITSLGSLAAWFEAVARIPFVAGIDRYLPAAFGKAHPKYGSPHVALMTQALITVVFVILGQAGTTIGGAYQVLVSLTIIVTFVPFVLLFASALRLARSPAEDALRLPGGTKAVVACATVGLLTTLGAIVLGLIPPETEANRVLAAAKLMGATAAVMAAGAAVYWFGRRGKAA